MTAIDQRITPAPKSVNTVSNENGVETGSTHVKNYSEESLRFYNWYVKKCYPHYKKSSHPRLKKAQRETVLSSLDSFISENGLDLEGLGNMANKYFQGEKNCDHKEL